VAGCPLFDDPDPAIQLLHREGEEVPQLLRLLFVIFPRDIEPLVDSGDTLGDQLDLAAQVFHHDLGAVHRVRQLLDPLSELVDTLGELVDTLGELVDTLGELVDTLVNLQEAFTELVDTLVNLQEAFTELVDTLVNLLAKLVDTLVNLLAELPEMLGGFFPQLAKTFVEVGD